MSLGYELYADDETILDEFDNECDDTGICDCCGETCVVIPDRTGYEYGSESLSTIDYVSHCCYSSVSYK